MEPICFDQNQAQYLPAMAAGECVASLAITEPDAGSDMQVALLKYSLYSPRAVHAWAVNYRQSLTVGPGTFYYTRHISKMGLSHKVD